MAKKQPTEKQKEKEAIYNIRLNPTQIEALTCKATEVMFGGAKAGGKSFFARYSALILATAIPFIQIYIFRQTFSEVRRNFLFGKDGLLNLTKPLVENGDCTVNLSDNRIDFCNGAQIYLRHLATPADVEGLRGNDLHVCYFDESTQWLTRDMLYQLRTCMRCSLEIDYEEVQKEYPFITEGYLPRYYALTNPGGRSHHVFKEMFIDSIPPNTDVQMAPEEGGMVRRFIPSKISDNKTLMRTDPHYRDKLLGSGGHVKKMLEGDWSSPEGACLAEEWSAKYNTIDPFDLPTNARIDRSYDFGTSKPWACVYTYESNGEALTMLDGSQRAFPSGTLFIIGELYGWNGRADEGDRKTIRQQGASIKEYEMEQPWGKQIEAGPGDGAIFNATGMDKTLNDDLLAGYNSVKHPTDSFWNQRTDTLFTPADKSQGSIAKGLAMVKAYLRSAHASEDGTPSDEAGLIFFNTCKQCIRTLPTLPFDDHDPSKYDTKSEDHLMDCIRYRVFTNRPRFHRLQITGL